MSSTDFEWQTDEEEVVARPLAEPVAGQSRLPWRWIVGVLLLAMAVYAGIRWRTFQQTEAITTDVKIAHSLLQEAEAAQDVELLNLVLSGRDLGWQGAQQQLLAEGNFASRPAFGLQALAPADEAELEVALSPDLAEVTVVSPQLFAVAGGGEVLLQQTAVYRQGTRNWLLAPPEEAFWGQTVITNTHYFTVTYPQRDAQLVQKITADLDRLFAERLCGRILQCGNLALDLRFSPNPQSLVAVNDPMALLLMGDSLGLPTPTLVGLPVDEVGYMALARGYGAQVVTAVIAHLFAYECCEHALITHALLTKQASELGLQTWPLTTANYKQLLNMPFRDKTAEEILLEPEMASSASRAQAYALVDFLMSETDWNPTQLLAALSGQGGAALYLPELVQERDFVYQVGS